MPQRPLPPAEPPAPRPPVDAPPALALLASPSWSDVLRARVLLVGDRLRSLAAVVEMVDRDDLVPLTSTADLIYPGARQFYGHGRVVPYDLDHLGDRAGWVLEQLTLWDFGFSEGVNAFVPEDPAHAAPRRAAARAVVHDWWPFARGGWRCYDALVDALRSARPKHAYRWLNGWESQPCDGFTPARFKRELLPIVMQHAADPRHPFHAHAKDLLVDLNAHLAKLAIVPPSALQVQLEASTAATTISDVERWLGPPVADLGSGIHIFEYRHPSGVQIRVGSPDRVTILYIRWTEHGRETVLYSR